jgi:hypothetical protein
MRAPLTNIINAHSGLPPQTRQWCANEGLILNEASLKIPKFEDDIRQIVSSRHSATEEKAFIHSLVAHKTGWLMLGIGAWWVLVRVQVVPSKPGCCLSPNRFTDGLGWELGVQDAADNCAERDGHGPRPGWPC